MNERTQISLISMFLIFLLVIIITNLNYLHSDDYSVKEFKDDIYEDLSDAYQNDPEVVKVYDLCLDSKIKSVCVHENIDFVWSESFEQLRKNYFFSPTEMVEYNGYGVCRDIAVFRMAVLKKLNINAQFVFTSNHVYLRTFEKGKVYELNNEFIFID